MILSCQRKRAVFEKPEAFFKPMERGRKAPDLWRALEEKPILWKHWQTPCFFIAMD